MKSVLLIGMGRFGRHAARKFHELGHQVMAVDTQESRLQSVLDVVTKPVVGNATRRDFIRTLGVKDFDLCIVAIGDDFESSLVTTAYLKEEGAVKIISRASRDVQARFLLANGADEVIYPEKQLAEWTAMRFSSDSIFDYLSLGDGYAVYEIKMPDKWVGKSIAELDVRNKFGVNILAIRHSNTLEMAINPSMVLSGEDTILILGRQEELLKRFHLK